MKMDIVASSGNDEFYTPDYAIVPILKYIDLHCPSDKSVITIWCPFDTKESRFVKVFMEAGYTVINTHVSNGENFFDMEVPDCDFIVSNPPYSCKTQVLERLFEINKPFAMLVGVVGLFESQRRFNLFKNNRFEIMYFNKRVSYLRSYGDTKPALNPPFSSVYVCKDVLPSQIIFEEINK